MSLFTSDTHFVVYMDAKDPTPTQELNSREGLARIEFLRRSWILCVHIDDEVSIRCKERHLALRVPLIRAIGICFNELANGQSVGGLARRNRSMRIHDQYRRSNEKFIQSRWLGNAEVRSSR